MKLILASTSARRRELLARLQIPFEVIPPSFEEKPTDRSVPDEALYFAEQKARSVVKQTGRALILGSDTLIECNGEKIGKANNDQEAISILKKLSGKKHHLYTAVVLLNTEDQSIKRHLEEVVVLFRQLSEKEIRDYVAIGEPIGKAGAYAVQGEGKKLIQDIKGDLQAVIGLPLRPIREWIVPS